MEWLFKTDHIFNNMWNKVGLLFLFQISLHSHKNNLYQPGIWLAANRIIYKWPNFRLDEIFFAAGKQLPLTASPTYHHLLAVHASSPCCVKTFTLILTHYRDVPRLFLRGESSTYLLEPALASLHLLLDDLGKARLLSPQDFLLCRRPQSQWKKTPQL